MRARPCVCARVRVSVHAKAARPALAVGPLFSPKQKEEGGVGGGGWGGVGERWRG